MDLDLSTVRESQLNHDALRKFLRSLGAEPLKCSSDAPQLSYDSQSMKL